MKIAGGVLSSVYSTMSKKGAEQKKSRVGEEKGAGPGGLTLRPSRGRIVSKEAVMSDEIPVRTHELLPHQIGGTGRYLPRPSCF